MRVCLCELVGRPVAIPVSAVEEVFTLGQVTPVPGAPAWVLGATSRRGQVLPVLWPTELGEIVTARPGHSVLVLREGTLRAAIPIDGTHGIQEAVETAPGEVQADGRTWSLLSPTLLARSWREEVAKWTSLGEGLSREGERSR